MMKFLRCPSHPYFVPSRSPFSSSTNVVRVFFPNRTATPSPSSVNLQGSTITRLADSSQLDIAPPGPTEKPLEVGRSYSPLKIVPLARIVTVGCISVPPFPRPIPAGHAGRGWGSLYTSQDHQN